ncbi:MAG: hypothetical protein K9W44_08265 [Candidatus Lokiarchaeota archaeon]|nr:hypothetical protein [Candidatus Harpocratesius repetitus]
MSTPVQRYRNRLRLSALFLLFPIYKFITSLITHNSALAITMGLLSLLYAGVLIYLYIKKNPLKKADAGNLIELRK